MDDLEALKAEGETEELLEELQRAAELHQAILLRQGEIIQRLRAELKGVQPR